VRSARAGARLTLLAGIAALSLALGGAASAAGGVKASFKAITADGSFVVFETAARLVPSDFDSAVDVYARAGASTVLLSDRSGPGDAEIPATFEAVNGNGSVVVFETAESLLPADTDSAVDVYERAGSSIVLLSDRSGPGDPDIPAQFKAMRSDGAIVVFETAEPLLPADQDSAVDVYERAGSSIVLLSDKASGDANIPASFKAMSDDGSIVAFQTAESLLPADSDTAQDVYERAGASTVLMSDGTSGSDADKNATFRSMTPDGSIVVFETAERLLPEDSDSANDVYERAGANTVLVSRS